MPVASITVARDEIQTVFSTAWLASVTSQELPVYYSDVRKDPPADRTFARITVQHAAGNQATLGRSPDQKRRWRRNGVVTVQLFTPFGEGLTLSDQLVKVVQDAYEGATTPSGIWFRNVRVNEIGQDGDRFQTNVLIDFEYDEIK